jgi:hypothetical protein
LSNEDYRAALERISKMAGEDSSQKTIPAKHPLVGAGVHWKDERGYTRHKATIIEVISSGSTQVGDLALLQYFDWIIGEPSTRRLVRLSELASSEQWVLYSSVEEMNAHYERIDRYQNENIQNADGD